MSVRTAKARQRQPEPALAPELRYATEAAPALRELLRLSQKLSRRQIGRHNLAARISESGRKTAQLLGQGSGHGRYTSWTMEFVKDAENHTGWVLDFESLGEVSLADLEAGLACQITHERQSWHVTGIYQKSVNKGNPPLNIGAHLVGAVTLARLLRIDPQMVLIQPALDSYSEFGCTDFYAMVGSLTKLLAPLSTR